MPQLKSRSHQRHSGACHRSRGTLYTHLTRMECTYIEIFNLCLRSASGGGVISAMKTPHLDMNPIPALEFGIEPLTQIAKGLCSDSCSISHQLIQKCLSFIWTVTTCDYFQIAALEMHNDGIAKVRAATSSALLGLHMAH